MVSVKPEVKETLMDLRSVNKRQLPYISALALTRTAYDARGQIQRDMPSTFIIRNQWAIRGVRVEPAQKSEMRARGKTSAVVKHIDENMAKQERGGRIRAKRKMVAIPTDSVRSSKTQKITRAKRPKALLAKPRYFIGEDSAGRPAIFHRKSKKVTRVAYFLREVAQYRPVYGFEATVRRVAIEKLPTRFREAADGAIASAK